MKIAIASTGRFHVLDLARELHHLGHEVTFYSYVPRERAVRFGLPSECHVSLLGAALPYLASHRLGLGWLPGIDSLPLHKALNRAVIKKLAPCDVFICMSGVYLEAAEYARDRYGARIFLERGSMHVDTQDEILKAIGGRQITQSTLERERAGYDLADRIAIPACHVAESFLTYQSLAGKTFVNPYGVDLEMFPQRAGPPPNLRRVLFVGNWSYQKGCDQLTEAISRLRDVELVHVGAILDAPLPEAHWFTHHEPVDQSTLTEFYQSATVFALASRQEGLALVQAQALASGLPLVCTRSTGGRDLAHSHCLKERIEEVPVGDATALSHAIAKMLDRIARCDIGPISEADRQLLSWRAYGERYAAELEQDVVARPSFHSV